MIRSRILGAGASRLLFFRGEFLLSLLLAYSSSTLAQASDAKLVAKGKTVYQSNCTACHHMDPSKVGPLGPEVSGSSKDLLEARILRKAYPEGYKPKRKTQVMQALPQLKGDLDALEAFLNSK